MALQTLSPKPGLTFREYFVPVWAARKRVFIISVLVGLLTLGINFLLPKYYKANAIILPETDKGKLSSMGSLAGLASLAGVNVNGNDISRLYPVILTSESVLLAVLERKYLTERFKDSVTLVQYMDFNSTSPAKNIDDALTNLKSLLSVKDECSKRQHRNA
jgi:uncharacterized protein involved in exopolysaccharide biosynthesis